MTDTTAKGSEMEKAVEAAAQALWEASPHHPNWTWDDCHPQFDQEVWRKRAHTALTAALPLVGAREDSTRIEELLTALNAANAGNVELLDRVSKLNDENFALAAGACHGGYGDEYGNWRCKYQDQIASLVGVQRREDVATLLANTQYGEHTLHYILSAWAEPYDEPVTPAIQASAEAWASKFINELAAAVLALLAQAEQPQDGRTNDAGKIATALGLLSSRVKSGEDWSEHCERANLEAFDALARLAAAPAAPQPLAEGRVMQAREAEIERLRSLLKECANRFERCCRAAGSDAQTAADAVEKYRFAAALPAAEQQPEAK